jgi:hypothetical protein
MKHLLAIIFVSLLIAISHPAAAQGSAQFDLTQAEAPSNGDQLSTAEVEIISTDPYNPEDLALLESDRWILYERPENYVTSGVGVLDLSSIGENFSKFISGVGGMIGQIGERLYGALRTVIQEFPNVISNFFQNATTILRFPAERLGSAVLNSLRAVLSSSLSALSDYAAPLLVELYSPTLPRMNGDILTGDVMRVVRDGIKVVMLIVFGLGAISILARTLHGMINQSSAAFSAGIEEAVKFAAVAIIAFNGHTMVDAGYSILNTMITSACGDSCSAGHMIKALTMPTLPDGSVQTAGSYATDFVQLLFAPIVVVIILFCGIGYAIAKILLAGAILLFSPLFISFFVLPYGENVVSGWIDAIKRLLFVVAASIAVSLVGNNVIEAIGIKSGDQGPIIAIAGLGAAMIAGAAMTGMAVSALTNVNAGAVVFAIGSAIGNGIVRNTALVRSVSANAQQQRQFANQRGGSAPIPSPSQPAAAANNSSSPASAQSSPAAPAADVSAPSYVSANANASVTTRVSAAPNSASQPSSAAQRVAQPSPRQKTGGSPTAQELVDEAVRTI